MEGIYLRKEFLGGFEMLDQNFLDFIHYETLNLVEI